MQLWEEAEKISVFGVEMYRFGFFAALGMAAAVAVMAMLSWLKRCEKGTAPLLSLMSLVMGALFSRLGFCLLNQELGHMMPLRSWGMITGGGWSMVGVVGGTLLAAWTAALLTRQRKGKLLDMAACALPVFLALERIGEDRIPDFDYSRVLESTFLNDTFLTFSDYDGYYLATCRLAALLMPVIFLILIWDMIRNKRDGDTCLLFLLLFGAVTVLLESLRYDRFLSISFVGLEQILAAVMMFIAIAVLAKRGWKRCRGLALSSLISVFAAVGIAVGLEFALDRTNMNKLLIYTIYVLVMFTPVVLSLLLRKKADE